MLFCLLKLSVAFELKVDGVHRGNDKIWCQEVVVIVENTLEHLSGEFGRFSNKCCSKRKLLLLEQIKYVQANFLIPHPSFRHKLLRLQ